MLWQLCSHKLPVLQVILPQEHILLGVLQLNGSLRLRASRPHQQDMLSQLGPMTWMQLASLDRPRAPCTLFRIGRLC